MHATAGPLRPFVEPFVTLPADVRFPEGLASNPANGDILVGTFDAREPPTARNNQVLRYSPSGRLIARLSFGADPLTGLAVRRGQLYMLNFGASTLQRVDARLQPGSPIEDVAHFGPLGSPAVRPREVRNPDGSTDRITFGSSGQAALNGMVFDGDDNLYVSDSFQGAVYRIRGVSSCRPCVPEVVSRDPLLATTGHPPFGANGLAFGRRPGVLYITNAGDGRLLRLALDSGVVSVLSEGLPGADGLLFHQGLLWVAANQADAVFGVDEEGLVRVRAGEFVGIRPDGSPEGLLFPASTAVTGPWMVVTNLALPLTPAIGDEWEEKVRRWNLVRFRIPSVAR